jgi:hypothetical protein
VDAKKGVFSLRSLGSERSVTGDLLSTGWQSFGQGVEIARMEGFTDLGEEKVLVFRPDGTSHAARIVLTGARPDANRETLWQIAVDAHGAVQCQEGPADETSE